MLPPFALIRYTNLTIASAPPRRDDANATCNMEAADA